MPMLCNAKRMSRIHSVKSGFVVSFCVFLKHTLQSLFSEKIYGHLSINYDVAQEFTFVILILLHKKYFLSICVNKFTSTAHKKSALPTFSQKHKIANYCQLCVLPTLFAP